MRSLYFAKVRSQSNSIWLRPSGSDGLVLLMLRNRLKCNRQLPCSSCETRGNSAKCTYASKQESSWLHAPGVGKVSSSRSPSNQINIQRRLDRLEQLIVDAASNQGPIGIRGASDSGSSNSQHMPANKILSQKASENNVGTLKKIGPGISLYAGETAFDGMLQEVGSVLFHFLT